MNPTKLTILYFKFGGRAEPLRLAAAAGKIPFTNRAVESPEFREMKDTLPLGQLPVLELEYEDGSKKVMTQSDAILRYLGKRGGLYPEDPVQAMKVDEILDAMKDGMRPVEMTVMGAVKTFVSETEFTDDEKLAIRKRICESCVPKYFGFLENTLKENGTGWLVGDKLTIADLRLHQAAGWIKSGILDGMPPSTLEPFPLVLECCDKVENVPEIAKWLEKYPKPYTTFDFEP